MKDNNRLIFKTKAEVLSGLDRQRWAELLILQLPNTHEGRNSWLLNYGVSLEAVKLQKEKEMIWSEKHDCALQESKL